MKSGVRAEPRRPKLPGQKTQFFFERMLSRKLFRGQLKNGFLAQRGKLRLGGFFLFVLGPVALFLFGAGHWDLVNNVGRNPIHSGKGL